MPSCASFPKGPKQYRQAQCSFHVVKNIRYFPPVGFKGNLLNLSLLEICVVDFFQGTSATGGFLSMAPGSSPQSPH